MRKNLCLLLNTVTKRRLHQSYTAMGKLNILHYQETHNDQERDPSLGSPPEEFKNGAFPFTLNKKSTLQDYLDQNRLYAQSLEQKAPEILPLNKVGQSPHTLWIGCSDSRISEDCLGVLPGEVFTHRNIANIVTVNDTSIIGAVQFALEVLKVSKIIVCGHTDCGGIWASLSSKKIGGILDHWLQPVRHVRAQNMKALMAIKDPNERCAKLSELNVVSSVTALKRHPSCSYAIKNGLVEVYGVIYDVGTGLLREVEIPVDHEFESIFHVTDDETEDHNPH